MKDSLAVHDANGWTLIASPTPTKTSEPLRLLDLELLHNYSFDTYATFAGKGLDHEVLRTNIVQCGLRHPYVLHSLLAISALHIHYKDATRSTLPNVAAEHFDKALNQPCPTSDPIDDFVLYFNLTRGVHTIVRHHWAFLEHSWIGPLFQPHESVSSPAGPASDYPRVQGLQQ
ncbi:hypothetical protein E4T47_01655 [Aureobasidium subglaciale]|nr:hypothetical protein E4T47_01655 [Aureobasidium subglaciale]